jgi:hypothetical protein
MVLIEITDDPAGYSERVTIPTNNATGALEKQSTSTETIVNKYTSPAINIQKLGRRKAYKHYLLFLILGLDVQASGLLILNKCAR